MGNVALPFQAPLNTALIVPSPSGSNQESSETENDDILPTGWKKELTNTVEHFILIIIHKLRHGPDRLQIFPVQN